MMDVAAPGIVSDVESAKEHIVVRIVITRLCFVTLVCWRSIGAFLYTESRYIVFLVI
jgi:hypothetical protein